MIKIVILNGLEKGRVYTSAEVANMGLQPGDLFEKLIKQGVEWKLDLSRHREGDDMIKWVVEDTAARCIRALLAGRPVIFMGKVYTGATPDVVGRLEDAIVYSGKYYRLEQDDENGVVIVDYDIPN